MAKWLSTLEKKLEEHSENSHPEFRVFISAEPAPSPEGHIIPQGILENSIKITSEPPRGMHTNLHKALDNFTQVQPRGGRGEERPPPQRADSTGLEEHAPVGEAGAWRGSDWAQSSATWAKRIPFVTGLLPAPTECNPTLSSQTHLGELSLGWAFFGERHGGALCKPPCHLNIPRWRGATLLEI